MIGGTVAGVETKQRSGERVRERGVHHLWLILSPEPTLSPPCINLSHTTPRENGTAEIWERYLRISTDIYWCSWRPDFLYSAHSAARNLLYFYSFLPFLYHP